MKKALVLSLLCLFVLLLVSAPAFAAKADSKPAKRDRGTAAIVTGDRASDMAPQAASTGKAMGPNRTAMGYDAPNAIYPEYTVGSAYQYEHQRNHSRGRAIAIGNDGRVHFAWMSAPSGGGSTVRTVYYNSATRSMITWNFSHPDGTAVSGSGSGYCGVAVANNVGVVGHHNLTTGGTLTWNDLGSGSGSFQGPWVAPDSSCGGLETWHDTDAEDEYIWPIIDVETHPDNSYTLHMIATESTDTLLNGNPSWSSLVYWRATSFGAGMYGSCAHFVDSVATTGAVVCASRSTTANVDNVAIVYPKCKYDGSYYPYPSGVHSDIAYLESTDDGATWPTTATKITNYPNEDSVFNVGNMTALYTSDGNLHVVWDVGYSWPDEGGEDLVWVYTTPGALYHWDKTSGSTVTVEAEPEDLPPCSEGWDCGNFNRVFAKPNLAECGSNLYVTYTYFSATQDHPDCSDAGFANGELFARVSATGGVTWGPRKALTGTTDGDGCAAGSCKSEHWATTARYNVDSLSLMYTFDTDPGASTYDEGGDQESFMKFMRVPCFAMETFVELDVEPGGFIDPFHAAPNGSFDTTFTVTNLGNTTADVDIALSPSVGWASVDAGSMIPPAIDNSDEYTLSITAPSTEGLYITEIQITHNDSKGVVTMPVELYCFTNFFVPENATIRTGANELSVQQVSRVGVQDLGKQMQWFDNDDKMLYDGCLILGYDANNLFTNIFYELGDTVADDNPLRELRALGPIEYDSTSYPYRYATGIGCTADSTIGIRSEFYASTHPDSAGFYIGVYKLAPGPAATVGVDINDVLVAYATDWDVPSDSGSDNKGHGVASKQFVYQQGQYLGSADGNEYKYGGIAYRGGPNAPVDALGGFYWENEIFVYPDPPTNSTGGYHADTLWKYLPGISGWGPMPYSTLADSSEDLNSIISIDNDASLTWSAGVPDTMEFYIIFVGSIASEKSVGDLNASLSKAVKFIGTYINSEVGDCKCGDADGNDIWNISDAVFLIAYIFGGGPAPDPLCLGDADGNGIVNISDAVYLIAYIFGGGPEPHCP